MPRRVSLRRAKSVLHAEIAAIRSRDPDVDAGDITRFVVPLLLRAAGVLALGLVPLVVVRSDAETDALLVPLIGSLALTVICTAVVSWLTAIVISGLVVMVLYRTSATASSQVVVRSVADSFGRIDGTTSNIALLALLAGLVSLAIGLPTRRDDDLANSVVDDLLAAQVGILLAALAFAFIAESVRSSAEIVDDQSLREGDVASHWQSIKQSNAWAMIGGRH